MNDQVPAQPITPVEPAPTDPMPAPTAESTPATAAPVQNGATVATSMDVEMSEAAPVDPVPPQAATPHTQQQLPASLPTPTHATSAPSNAPTPSRNSPHPTTHMSAPVNPNPHGSPTRVYLNSHVTPHLLEAMKHLVTAEPDKPLKWLSEYLAQKSAEIEGVQ